MLHVSYHLKSLTVNNFNLNLNLNQPLERRQTVTPVFVKSLQGFFLYKTWFRWFLPNAMVVASKILIFEASKMRNTAAGKRSKILKKKKLS